MEAKKRGGSCKRLGRNKRNPGLRVYTPAEGQRVDPVKRQVKFPHLMPLPNRSLETRMHMHVSAVRSPTAYHTAHYHAVSTSPLKRRTPAAGRKAHRWTLLGKGTTGSLPTTNLEGSKVGPRQGSIGALE
jgi:hypothetical protein